MARQVRCKTCGGRFYREHGSNRLNCETCRPPRVRSQATTAVIPTAMGDLEQVTYGELTARGRLDTIAGRAALHAARQLDRGGHTGSQTSALLREMRAAADAALEGATVADDALDEVARRRAVKAAGA